MNAQKHLTIIKEKDKISYAAERDANRILSS